jgi:hypothetical protein
LHHKYVTSHEKFSFRLLSPQQIRQRPRVPEGPTSLGEDAGATSVAEEVVSEAGGVMNLGAARVPRDVSLGPTIFLAL